MGGTRLGGGDGAAPSGPMSVLAFDNAGNDTPQTSHSFTLTTAPGTLVFYIIGYNGGGADTITDIKVDGSASITPIHDTLLSGWSDYRTTVCVFESHNAATATITYNTTKSHRRNQIACYSVPSTATEANMTLLSANNNTTNTGALEITTVGKDDGGLVLGFGYMSLATSTTWAGLTERIDGLVQGASGMLTTADEAPTSDLTNQTVSITPNVASRRNLVTVQVSPP